MATAVGKRLEGDRWVEVPATWGTYVRLDRDRGEKANPKLIYADGRLTIVTKGYPHENVKLLLSWFIETMFVELGVRFSGSGEMTLKQGKGRQKGVEGDTSYYLTNLERVRGKRRVVMGVDPPPDLAVEVVVSHPVENALVVYAAFGVREVWVCREDGVTFLTLRDGARYEPSPASLCLPVLSSEEFTHWVCRDDFADEVDRRRAFREWVVTTLAPRRAAGGG